jgi:hypothetical protein
MWPLLSLFHFQTSVQPEKFAWLPCTHVCTCSPSVT